MYKIKKSKSQSTNVRNFYKSLKFKIKIILQKYYAQLYCNKIDNLNAMGKFCKTIY